MQRHPRKASPGSDCVSETFAVTLFGGAARQMGPGVIAITRPVETFQSPVSTVVYSQRLTRER